jgi:hypothetical protein
VAFLNNLVLFKMEEEAAETSPEPTKPRRHTRR